MSYDNFNWSTRKCPVIGCLPHNELHFIKTKLNIFLKLSLNIAIEIWITWIQEDLDKWNLIKVRLPNIKYNISKAQQIRNHILMNKSFCFSSKWGNAKQPSSKLKGSSKLSEVVTPWRRLFISLACKKIKKEHIFGKLFSCCTRISKPFFPITSSVPENLCQMSKKVHNYR